jgi:hypothetical protein
LTLAPIEDADLQRRMLIGIVEERDNLLLHARIERARVDLATGGLDLLGQRRELVAVAATGEDRKALGGELLGDLAANEITGTNDGDRPVSLLHGVLRPVCCAGSGRPVSLGCAATRPICVSKSSRSTSAERALNRIISD